MPTVPGDTMAAAGAAREIDVLVVDPDITEESPSLRSLLLARPLLERNGMRVMTASRMSSMPSPVLALLQSTGQPFCFHCIVQR